MAPKDSRETADATISKFLSLVLRHKPQSIGLTLDRHGWASIDALMEKSNAAGVPFTRNELLHIAATSDKKRFAISNDQLSIRAVQGHSIPVDLGLTPQAPPPSLYHGTTSRYL